MIELKELTCPICHKKYQGFTFACSDKCVKELAKIIAVVGVAGQIKKINKQHTQHFSRGGETMTYKIKFSHKYKKVWNQTEAQLIDVRLRDATKLCKDLILYDTTYTNQQDGFEASYPLPKTGLLIQLTFMGDKAIPFCTLRPHNPEKWQYYNSLLHKQFQVVIV